MKREVEVRLEMANERARREAEAILADARRTVEQAFDEIDEMRRAADRAADHQAQNAARAELRRQLNAAEEKYAGKVEEQRWKMPGRSGRGHGGDRLHGRPGGGREANADGVPAPSGGHHACQRPTGRGAAAGEQRQAGDPQDRFQPADRPATVSVPRRSTSGAWIPWRPSPWWSATSTRPCWPGCIRSPIIHGKGTGALRAAVQQACGA